MAGDGRQEVAEPRPFLGVRVPISSRDKPGGMRAYYLRGQLAKRITQMKPREGGGSAKKEHTLWGDNLIACAISKQRCATTLGPHIPEILNNKKRLRQ